MTIFILSKRPTLFDVKYSMYLSKITSSQQIHRKGFDVITFDLIHFRCIVQRPNKTSNSIRRSAFSVIDVYEDKNAKILARAYFEPLWKSGLSSLEPEAHLL